MSNKVKQELEKIEIPEELHKRVVLGAQKAKSELGGPDQMTDKPAGKRGMVKKITYFSCAAALILCLLMGSAFVSPAMANVMSNIPYFNQIVQSLEKTQDREKGLEGFFSKVSETLSEKNDQIDVSMSSFFTSESPTVLVRVRDKKYEQVHGNEIKQTVRELAKSSGVGKVKVELKVKKIPEINENDKKRMQLTHQLFKITDEALKKANYNVQGMGVNTKAQMITVEIKEPKKDFDKVTIDVKRIVHNAVYSKKHLNYKVEITRQTQAEITDENWQPIFGSVIEETHKKFSVVNGFAYSFHPKPLEIIIKTSLSRGEQDKKKAEQIAKYAVQVVKIKRSRLSVKKIPYKIIIRDKDKKNLYETLHAI